MVCYFETAKLRLLSLECDDEEEENADQSQNGEAEEANSSSHSPRTLDQSDNEDDDQQEDEEPEEDEEEATKSRRSQGLKIKLSIKPLRKSSRESRPRVRHKNLTEFCVLFRNLCEIFVRFTHSLLIVGKMNYCFDWMKFSEPVTCN